MSDIAASSCDRAVSNQSEHGESASCWRTANDHAGLGAGDVNGDSVWFGKPRGRVVSLVGEVVREVLEALYDWERVLGLRCGNIAGGDCDMERDAFLGRG